MIARRSSDKTRLVLLLTAVLWATALAAIFLGVKLRLKPVLLLGGLDAMLALFVTLLVFAGRRRA